jgi:hypothetical protein
MDHVKSNSRSERPSLAQDGSPGYGATKTSESRRDDTVLTLYPLRESKVEINSLAYTEI